MTKKETAERDKGTQIVPVESHEQTEVSTFITQAIQQNLPVETMEKLFALHEKAKASQARSAFVSALGKFQANCPIVEKTKRVLNRDGTVRYQYAPLDAIISVIREALASSGLSYTWSVENKPGVISVTATLTHQLGHSESSSFEVPIDKEGFMTAPQKYASALTFAKRYALCNVLGVMTGEEDTDATDVVKEPEVKSAKARITFAFKSLGKDTLKWTPEEWAKEVKSRTGLQLIEKNFVEIANRLEVIVSEATQDETRDIS